MSNVTETLSVEFEELFKKSDFRKDAIEKIKERFKCNNHEVKSIHFTVKAEVVIDCE